MGELLSLTEKDQQSAAYKLCMVAAAGSGVASGLMVGRWLGVNGVLVGAAAGAALGLVVGLKTCPRLSAPVKDKLFGGKPLNRFEIQQAVEAMAGITGVRDSADALELVAVARIAAPAAGQAYPGQCLPARMAAQQMLRLRG